MAYDCAVSLASNFSTHCLVSFLKRYKKISEPKPTRFNVTVSGWGLETPVSTTVVRKAAGERSHVLLFGQEPTTDELLCTNHSLCMASVTGVKRDRMRWGVGWNMGPASTGNQSSSVLPLAVSVPASLCCLLIMYARCCFSVLYVLIEITRSHAVHRMWLLLHLILLPHYSLKNEKAASYH